MIEHLAEGVTIYLGDCREILPTLGKVDAVVTDPPYGINYKHSGKGMAVYNRKLNSTIKHSVKIIGDEVNFDPKFLLKFPSVLIWGANNFAHSLPINTGRWLIWDKADGRYDVDSFGDAEIAWHNKGKAARIFRYAWKGVYCKKDGEDNGRRLHPSMKPLGLMRWCIKQSKISDNSIILDPFMGSGTTGVAAVKMGRKFIGIEIEPKYFEISCRRISEALKQPDLFIEKAKPFEQQKLTI